MHTIVKDTLNDRNGKRIDLFSLLIELYGSWLAFESCALMCSDVHYSEIVAVIQSNRSKKMNCIIGFSFKKYVIKDPFISYKR